MLKTGLGFDLFLLLAVSIVTYIYIYRSSQGNVPELRVPPALEAIDEIVGRATEMGRPITYCTSYVGLQYSSMALQNLAGISVLGYMAKKAAEYDTRIIGCFATGDLQLIAEDVVRESYIAAGKPEKEVDMRFLTPMEYAYASATMGIMRREKIAGNVMLGAIAGENVLWGATAAELGAIQLGGMAISQVCFFVALCDYVLIGEELYVAGAVLSEDKTLISALASEDIAKFVILGLTILGAILASAGVAQGLIDFINL
jgi:hypothetical protein